MNIIPKPLKEEIYKGECILPDGVICRVNSAHKDTYLYMKKLFRANHMRLGTAGAQIELITRKRMAPGAYDIKVTDTTVRIEARDSLGSFYAVQTIRQMAGQDLSPSALLTLPVCHVADKPKFGWRAFMLDESRHFFGKKEVLRTLDMMAFYKLNVLHWHLSDDQGFRIEIKKHPRLTEIGAKRARTALNHMASGKTVRYDNEEYFHFYTQDDVREIVAYAKDLHIDILPEIDMPGHITAMIAAYPELACKKEKTKVAEEFGIFKHIACAGKEGIYTLAKDIIDELSELFPFPYFHIGGDEAPKDEWRECPDCQNKISLLNLNDEEDLQAYFNSEIEKHLRQRGKIMIGWSEILKSKMISDSAIFQWWIDLGGKAQDRIKSGHKAILSPTQNFYFDYLWETLPLKKTYSFTIKDFGLSEKDTKNILGIEAAAWSEWIISSKRLEFGIYPRMQAFSEVCWTPEKLRNYDDFLSRLAYHEKVMDKKHIFRATSEIYGVEQNKEASIFKAPDPQKEFHLCEKLVKEAKGKTNN